MAGLANNVPKTLWTAQGVRIPSRVFCTSSDAVQHVVLMIEHLIREKQSAGTHCVLGLPTGSTPVGVYRELARLHKQGLDFSNVVTFNLDEYFPMKPDAVHSYHRFMRENLFDHVNIPARNIHIPDGTVSNDEIESYCDNYEQEIRRAGGFDLLLLGIGRTGHVGFNEPGSAEQSRTRLVRLDSVTRRDAASAFFGEENVPTMGLTIGLRTIVEAKKIVLMAFGEHKSNVIKRALENEPSESCPASLLQKHSNAVYVIDEPAAAELTILRTPWLAGRVTWTPQLVRRAVLWLSLTNGKALLKLTAEDFRKHNLHELLREHGPAHKLCQSMFDDMMATICAEPAGMDPKTVLCFSPHPDDDVISMGGTLYRLKQQGHDVHIAYMTSGNVAVHDHDARHYANFVTEFNQMFGIDNEKSRNIEVQVQEFLAKKSRDDIDSPEVLSIKSLIRRTEASTAAQVFGIGEENLAFLDLPFYRTGRANKRPIGDQDVQVVYELLERVMPKQIYVAGDLADPHGTHRLCADVCFKAVERFSQKHYPLEVWLYRGAWQEWEPHQIERAVPMTVEELEKKKAAILKHESQKDEVMFPGPDDLREFWQRAEDRNKGTALLYDRLGLPEFFAMEGFVRWKGTPI